MNKYKARIEEILDLILEEAISEPKREGVISLQVIESISKLVFILKELDKKTKK